MGRVYDALKRASDEEQNGKRRASAETVKERPAGSNGASRKNGEEHPWDRAPLYTTSASTAHTEELIGSALPEMFASRAAGATVDADGPTRVLEFAAHSISNARVEPHLVAITQPRSPYCEQFRSLRTRVLQAGERKKMQAFVVTSAGIAEGKTLTALNLAWLLAQTDGVRALLIDSDLRQPCATDYLGIDVPVGLSEVLAGEATLEEAIVKLEPSGLYLLPGGSARDDVAELLSGPKFSRVLAEVRRMFNYILIDAPPLGIFTDATVLINRADGALLVVRSGKTRYAALRQMLEPIPQERLLGVVLNRADGELSETDYYYQRRYFRPEDTETPAGKQMRKNEEATVVS